MIFKIRHHTRYQYSQSVRLSPQQLRFHPRNHNIQQVLDYNLKIDPKPAGINDHQDLEGNWVTQIWFDQDIGYFDIDVTMQVQTLRKDKLFNFILAQGATTLPINHEHDSICSTAYLQRIETDDLVTSFAAELSLAVDRNPLSFLDRLNRQLFTDFNHIHRDSGTPQTPAHTLQSRSGACRDMAVLFVDCCRAEGIAARFASGYQRGNMQSERRELHAWPEVYLPGAGWLGYDPTHGEPINDTHVTIAAAANSRDTMPVSGIYHGEGVSSTLDFKIEIKVSEDGAATNRQQHQHQQQQQSQS